MMALAQRMAGAYSDEHESLRESVRTHLERTAVPDAAEWEAAGGIPDAVLVAATEHGFVAAGVPEEHGGLGLDDVRLDAVVVEEAMSAGLPALALVLISHGDAPVRALRAAQDDRLAGIASGDLRASAILDASLRVDDRGRVSGRAPAVVGGTGAGLLVVLAEGSAGPVALAVARAAAGVEVAPTRSPIGLRAAGLADVRFTAAPGERLEGADAGDLRTGQRLLLAVASAAGAEAALRITVDYVRERRAFGTPIATFANTRGMLGTIAAELEAVSALVAECLRARVEGRLTPARAAAAKLQAAELHGRAVDSGVQLHGGYGYMLEYPIAHAFADARFLRLHGGTSQQLAEVAAGALDLG